MFLENKKGGGRREAAERNKMKANSARDDEGKGEGIASAGGRMSRLGGGRAPGEREKERGERCVERALLLHF